MTLRPGDVHECEKDEADRLVSRGIAVPVVEKRKRRKAVIIPDEKSVIE